MVWGGLEKFLFPDPTRLGHATLPRIILAFTLLCTLNTSVTAMTMEHFVFLIFKYKADFAFEWLSIRAIVIEREREGKRERERARERERKSKEKTERHRAINDLQDLIA